MMMDFKDIVAKGIYFNSGDSSDYLAWSKKMLDYYGYEIWPHMKYIRKWAIVIKNSLDHEKVPKLNCWQFMGCRFQDSENLVGAGRKCYECPAKSEQRFDGIHGGINGGRACWAVPHTLCYGGVQGNCEEKCGTCLTCDFYSTVAEEEEDNLMGNFFLR